MTSTALKRPFKDADLLAYSYEHLFYELDMFLALARIGGSGTELGASSAEDLRRLNNVLIEGFALHLRNVIDFLHLDVLVSKPAKKTDVVAADFFKKLGDWKKIRPPISGSLRDARARANREIAHLTTYRISGTPLKKAWEFTSLAAELRPLIQLFVEHALPSRLSPRVSEAMNTPA